MFRRLKMCCIGFEGQLNQEEQTDMSVEQQPKRQQPNGTAVWEVKHQNSHKDNKVRRYSSKAQVATVVFIKLQKLFIIGQLLICSFTLRGGNFLAVVPSISTLCK